MQSLLQVFIVGLVVSSSLAAFINPGKEYVYDYVSTVASGSEDYVNFASAYNITGRVRLQKTTPTLITIKLEDLKFGAYNGKYSYFPQPDFTSKTYQELNPLTEPFQVTLDENNLASGITLSGNIPEWARNMQRGLASALQLDTTKLTGTETNYVVQEKTVVGECPTTHQLIKNADGTTELRKYRAYVDCENNPTLYRKPGMYAQYCPDENTRDILNASSYVVYRVGDFNGESAMKQVRTGSGIIYSLFGPKGHVQYSWAASTFELLEIKAVSNTIPAPSSPKTHDNLRYVFQSQYTPDDDLQQPRPYFFHYSDAEVKADDATLAIISDRIYDNIGNLAGSLENTEAFDDLSKFHAVSPFQVLPDMASLPYQSLKSLYAKFKNSGKKAELQLFLDALVVAGTGPTVLLIKDIVETNKEPGIVARLIAPLPNYVRNPTEKLVIELEALRNTDSSKHGKRVIDLSIASLVSRACKKTKCQKSGLLEKYVKLFSDNYDAAETFEEKTVAVLCLRNIGYGGAETKLRTIVNDKSADRSVRIQAMPGAKRLTTEEAKETLLPIFYDKSEHHELRTTAAGVFLTYHFDDRTAQQMVMYMWTEKSKDVKNFMHTFLEGMAFTNRPCLKQKSAYARTALAIFPPWTVDRTLSGFYTRDYHDKDYQFGHMTNIAIQKSGESVLPVTIYGALNGAIAGQGVQYISFFVRIEGLGKSLAERIMSMTTGQIDFSTLQDVFQKVGIKDREATPLRIELQLMFHGRVIAYHAADQSTVTTIPELLKKLQEAKSSYDIELSRMMFLGGVIIEKVTELGTPVSIVGSATAINSIKVKTNREKTGNSITSNSDWNLQGQFYGLSMLTNHLPAFGAEFSVTALRTVRARVPRHFKFGIDLKALSFTFAVDTPTKEDPLMIMQHAVALTTVKSDKGKHLDGEVEALLQESCPTCKVVAVISKGIEHRGTRQVGIPEVSRFKVFEGVKRGVKYFDCEKPHTRYHTIKKVMKYFSEQNKNAGDLPIVRFLLGFQYMRDSIVLSPQTAACGMKAYYFQDPEAKSIFEKLEGQFRVKYTTDPAKKLGTKIQFKGTLNFKHSGVEPQTRTVEVAGQANIQGLEKREFKLRFLAKDESSGKNAVLCVDTSTQMKKAVDFFGYEGENEPTFERKMNFQWGPEEAGKDSCPSTGAYIKTTRVSRRSQEQVDESKAEGYPYKQCREQIGSTKYPGTTTPATYECMQAAIDQTNLRESNITIEYRLDVEARNRWKKPMVAVAAFLLPYWDTEKSTAAAHAHHHVETRGNAEFVEGKVEMDVSLSKNAPVLDIHWHGSQGDEHFHNVDLAAIPGPFKVKPVFSRFSPFYYNAFQAGIFGYCLNTPQTVLTFDNTTYHAELNECPTVLAADCDQKPRYAVLSKKLAEDKLGLIIYLGEHKLEINDLNKITIDGKTTVDVTDSVYTDPDEEQLFKFVKINPTYVGIVSTKLSIYIGYSGNWASVTAGSRYRGTSCGLCGNFDGNKYNDFVGPDATCKNLTPTDMMKAYVVREGSCSGVGTACPSTA